MKRIFLCLISAIVLLSSIGATVDTSAATVKYDIDFTLKNEGIVDVLYNAGSEEKIKLIIKKGNTQYIYNLSNNEEYVSFPLQLGDGSYDVTIYENIEGTSYKKVYSDSCYAIIDDEIAVFTESIQEINWTEEDDAIVLANTLVEEALAEKVSALEGTTTDLEEVTLTDEEVIDVIYTYIIDNMTYDYDKINGLSYDYIPDIDAVLDDNSGICYDYSVLLAAMLRSQDIPTKLIKGYADYTSVYHAWNEVYLESEERWVVVDSTYDAYMNQRNLEFAFEKSADEYTTSYEF